MLHGSGSGTQKRKRKRYAEAEAYGSAESRFLKNYEAGTYWKRVRIGSVYPYVCIYIYMCIYIYILKYKI